MSDAVSVLNMVRSVRPEAAGRCIPAEGAFNVRDLGGFETEDGRRVRRNLVFRSDDLSGLAPGGLAALAECGIRTVVDFRGGEEVELAPNRLPATVTRQIRLPIEPGSILALADLTCESGPALMCELYRALARTAQEMYWEFFRLLSNPGNAPLLFHCSAGKDRTGFAAALFLASLGVSREEIFDDYLLSAVFVEAKYRSAVEADSRYGPVFTVRREYLEAAFEVIGREFGGVHCFLVRRLGVDLARMRALYTD